MNIEQQQDLKIEIAKLITLLTISRAIIHKHLCENGCQAVCEEINKVLMPFVVVKDE